MFETTFWSAFAIGIISACSMPLVLLGGSIPITIARPACRRPNVRETEWQVNLSHRVLGSITDLFWQPRKRVLAFLIAFGGCALLATLVIDLVGNATEKGHLLELIVGSIVGSLFFTLVDRIVNRSGGFLRKPSSLLVYLTRQESPHFEKKSIFLQEIGKLYWSNLVLYTRL